MKSVNNEFIYENIDSINLIDIRNMHELDDDGYIENSINIPMKELLINHKQYLDKNITHYIFCHSGVRSKYVVEELSKLGYDLVNVEGGIISCPKITKFGL